MAISINRTPLTGFTQGEDVPEDSDFRKIDDGDSAAERAQKTVDKAREKARRARKREEEKRAHEEREAQKREERQKEKLEEERKRQKKRQEKIESREREERSREREKREKWNDGLDQRLLKLNVGRILKYIDFEARKGNLECGISGMKLRLSRMESRLIKSLLKGFSNFGNHFLWILLLTSALLIIPLASKWWRLKLVEGWRIDPMNGLFFSTGEIQHLRSGNRKKAREKEFISFLESEGFKVESMDISLGHPSELTSAAELRSRKKAELVELAVNAGVDSSGTKADITSRLTPIRSLYLSANISWEKAEVDDFIKVDPKELKDADTKKN